MFDRLRRRLTYANVMSTIAVFAVLAGGGAYAASKIGSQEIKKNAVRAKHIKAGNVKASDIATAAVDSAKVADESLTGADVAEATLGQVPSAANAASAASATSAGTAGDADLLDGKDSSAFLSDVVAATTGNMDPPNVAANSCFTGDMVVAGIQPGDHVVVTTPQDLSAAFSVTSLIPNANNEARVRLCNHTNAPVDEPVRTFNVIVIRP